MEKILLIYTDVRIRNQKPRPPVGLLYLAAALRPDYEPVLLDLRIDSDKLQQTLTQAENYLLVGISTIIGQQLIFSLEVAKLVRQLKPEMPIVFGGTFPSMAPEIVLKEKCIDVVCIGDGEDTLRALAQAYSQGTSLKDIPGIAYRENGKIVVQLQKLRSLDTPEMPAWDMVCIEDYREVNVLTSKGCTALCSFCYNRVFNYGKFRIRSVENVCAEIAYLHENRQVRHIAFVDDNFFADLTHAKQVMAAIRDFGWGITWETTCRADDLDKFDKGTLELIRESGCKELFVGFESASNKVLKRTGKMILDDQITRCMERARAYKFRLRALYIVGLVGESRKELHQTLRAVDRIRKNYPDCVKVPVFGIYTPYPQIPPVLEGDQDAYHEPESMNGWSFYHHDRANQSWLTQRQRDYLETVIWVYRFYSKRSRFTRSGGLQERLLYYDAVFRWKLRFFSLAPEWRAVRRQEEAKYHDALREARQTYVKILREEKAQ